MIEPQKGRDEKEIGENLGHRIAKAYALEG